MSTSETNKIQYFEYFLSKLYNHLGQKDSNDLSIVKSQKLLYFLSNSIKEEDKYPLFETFDNFYALPYGHVESDIYKAIKSESGFKLSHFVISRFGAKKILDFSFNNLDSVTEKIDLAFESLKNTGLIEKSASYLVDLSHCHESWVKNFREALKLNLNSKFIEKDDLTNEYKYFAL